MDDLMSQDWTSPVNKAPQPQSNNPFSKPMSSNASLRPSPSPSLSNTGSLQPSSRPSSGFNASQTAKATTPANDSFANLLGRNTPKASGSMTIQERQRQLLEEKRKQEAEQRQRYASQFGVGDAWDRLGSGRSTPLSGQPPPAIAATNGSLGALKANVAQESEEDILAAFNSAVPVDKSSHFPPPSSPPPANGHASATPISNALLAGNNFNDDDDPFGLGTLPQKNNASIQSSSLDADDDDILGDLAKPVTAKPPQRHTVDDAFEIAQDERFERPAPAAAAADPLDRAVAELVDMGFPADTSRVALLETGGQVQAAVSFLLNQAHEEAKQKSQGGSGSRRGTPSQNPFAAEAQAAEARASSKRRGRETDAVPAWMRQEGRTSSSQRRSETGSPAPEKDVTQYASEIGTSFLKSANSLWKQGRKQVQKAVQDFQVDHDPSQPKWMRDASADGQQRSSSHRRQDPPSPPEQRRQQTQQAPSLTDEAMLLDSSDGRPQKPVRSSRRPDVPQESRTQSPAQEMPVRSSPQPRFMQHQPPPPQQESKSQQPQPQQDKRPATKLSRLEVEAQSEQAYISPARRKRPAKPEPKPELEPEVDLFSPAPAKSSPAPRAAARSSAPAAAPAPRKAAPPRSIPAISPSALSTSSTHRRAGTEAFKRGDYDAAHTSYTAALNPLPPTHPLVIIVLSNRALTALKTGDPKTAISDADRALSIIGPSNGENEQIDLGASEGGVKEMREFYGKALMRKAEALEHMEKWSDAAAVYRACISAGVGGAVSLRARDRCEKAANPSSKPSSSSSNAFAASAAPKSVASKPAPKPAGRTVAPSRPTIPSAQSAEAVRKLRAANAAAEAADDEKFALNDAVDAKLAAWKGTKSDNLRALLGSLDTVLWPEAGWKKVGMSDLVMTNKVKIVYMKAIAKVHPDKIPQNATTEQRMISGAVFSTLNEAWDKFKKDNGL